MLKPPLSDGARTVTIADVLLGVTLVIDGAVGTVAGVTETGAVGTPPPLVFVATTVNE